MRHSPIKSKVFCLKLLPYCAVNGLLLVYTFTLTPKIGCILFYSILYTLMNKNNRAKQMLLLKSMQSR